MTGPALSNRLTVLAVEVAGEVAAYRRASTAAHRAYLAAGAMLVEAAGTTAPARRCRGCIDGGGDPSLAGEQSDAIVR